MSERSQLTTFHVAPVSSERHTEPWSAVWISAYMRVPSEGAIWTSTLPNGDFGIPVVIFVHFAPPSFVRYTPLPGPPLFSTHVCCSTCHVPASSVSGFFASIDRPEQPVLGSTKRTRCQLAPPSVVLKTPRSSCGPVRRPDAQT